MRTATVLAVLFVLSVNSAPTENEATEDSTASTTPMASSTAEATTQSDGLSTTVNATTPAGVCSDGNEPIVDATSCFVLCPKGAVFYDSAGPKADGEACVIKEYLEGTNFLKAEYPGTCNGKGRCLRLNETMANGTTLSSSSTSEHSATTPVATTHS